MFLFGLIVGIVIGGISVAFVINNLHTKKVALLEAQIAALAGKAASIVK